MTQHSNRNKRLDISISEPLDLDALRWLVNQCDALDGKSQITVKEHRSMSPVDWDPASITVHAEIKD